MSTAIALNDRPKLTPKQERVLEFVASFYARLGCAPTFREIM